LGSEIHFSTNLLSPAFVEQPIEVKDVESIDPEYFKNLGATCNLCRLKRGLFELLIFSSFLRLDAGE
jgi:hypothetical protein